MAGCLGGLMLLQAAVPVSAYSETHWVLEEDRVADYSYHDKDLEDKLNALVLKTIELKQSFDKKEAKKVLAELKELSLKITKEDYKAQYDAYKEQYEIGANYKYKYSQPVWIERTLLGLYLQNLKGNELSSYLKEYIQVVYDIGVDEMKKDCELHSSMTILFELNDIKKDVPSNMRDYIEYVQRESSVICNEFEDNGTKPKNENLEKAFDKKVKEEKEKEREEEAIRQESANQGKPSKDNYVTSLDTEADKIMSSGNDSNSYGSSGTIAESYTSSDDYMNQMNNLLTGSTVTNTDVSIENVYYTINKNEENPSWVDTGVSLEEDKTITCQKLITILSSISKAMDNSYLIEDTEQFMFIAEGKILVLNRQDSIPVETLTTIFESYKQLGLKTMLKGEEDVASDDSLNAKIEAGSINEVIIDDNKLILTNAPVLNKGIVQFPVTQVAKALGYEVNESNTEITLLKKLDDANELKIVLTKGSRNFTINEQKNSFKTEVQIVDKVTYAEFNTIAEKAGYTYQYNTKSGAVEFKTK